MVSIKLQAWECVLDLGDAGCGLSSEEWSNIIGLISL